ncbi:hypothetical protein [Metallumcola ferriviriculae]
MKNKSKQTKKKPYQMEVSEIYVEPKIKSMEEIREIDKKRKS